MAQLAFDHSCNMLADTTYADGCHRKKKLRQHKSPSGNYQADEDVWARHPNNGIMYIASVIGFNNYHRTCHVAFVADGQEFNLPVSHLRHVTREDIKRNRYIDYGRSWSERTSIGAINTYDRYGELTQVQFTGTSEDVFDESFTDEENNCTNDDTIDDRPLLNIINEDKDRIIAILRLLPILLEEMDNSQLLEIWPDLDIHLIEQLRRQSSSTESNTSKDESTSDLNEQTLVSYDMSEAEKPILSCYDENKLQLSKDLPDINNQKIEYTCPVVAVNDTQVDKSSQKVFDQKLLLDQTKDNKYQSSIVITDSKDITTIKEVDTQNESSTSSSIAHIEQRPEPIVSSNFKQLTKYHRMSTVCAKKRMNTYSLKFSQQLLLKIIPVIDKQHNFWSRLRFNNSFAYAFMKLLLFILSAIMIYHHLSTGPTITDKNIDFMTIPKLHMVSTDVIHQSAIALFVVSILPFFSVLNGPSTSMFELWPYPFAIP